MNKKVLIIIGAIVIIILAVLIYSSQKNKSVTDLLASPTPVAITDWANGVVYDTTNNKIKFFDPSLNSYQDVTSITGEIPTYAELSNDQKTLLYTTDPNAASETIEVNPDLSNLKVKSISDGSLAFEQNSIFSPKFLDDESIVYQDFSSTNSGRIILRSVQTGQILKWVDIGEKDPVDIYVLDQSHIICTQYSSDVGEVSSKLVNLNSLEIIDYINGEGLQFSTVYGSPYVASQTVSANKFSISLIKWQTKENVLSLDIPLEQLTWDVDGKNVYYIENNQIIQKDLTSQNQKVLQKVSPSGAPSLQMLLGGDLLLKTEQETSVIDLPI